jgi:hypothetical protein
MQASPYFAAVFDRWRRGAQTEPAGAGAAAPPPPPPPCILHVSHWEDVEAAIALLRCCYTSAFEPLPSPRFPEALLTAVPPAAARGRHQHQCWQQLAVRTLVLADRLDCGAVVACCIEALSGRLFAHQMSLDAAMAVLWLLPESLARQAVVASLQHMATVRMVQVCVLIDKLTGQKVGRRPCKTQLLSCSAHRQHAPSGRKTTPSNRRSLATWSAPCPTPPSLSACSCCPRTPCCPSSSRPTCAPGTRGPCWRRSTAGSGAPWAAAPRGSS